MGSVVHVMMRDTARRVSLEFTKSVGSICRARDSMYFKMATLTWRDDKRSAADYHAERSKPSCLEIKPYLQIWRLGLIDDKPHQDVELLVKWEGLPDKERKRFNFFSVIGCNNRSIYVLKES